MNVFVMVLGGARLFQVTLAGASDLALRARVQDHSFMGVLHRALSFGAPMPVCAEQLSEAASHRWKSCMMSSWRARPRPQRRLRMCQWEQRRRFRGSGQMRVTASALLACSGIHMPFCTCAYFAAAASEWKQQVPDVDRIGSCWNG